MATATPEKLKPFVFHGVEISWGSDSQATGDCPFCLKESHLYIGRKTGQWDCKTCGESGNVSTFLKFLILFSRKATTSKDYKSFGKDRGVTPEALKAWNVCKSIITGDWLVPSYNNNGKLANVAKYIEVSGKRKLLGTPGCKVHLFGTHQLNKNQTTRWVLEGPWDAMALWDILSQYKQKGEKNGSPRLVRVADLDVSMLTTQAVLAVPGAQTFKEHWLEPLQGHRVHLCYDNDYPRVTPTGKEVKTGWDGMKKAIKMMQSTGIVPKEVYKLTWGKEGYTKQLTNGYDIKDLIKDNGPTKALGTLYKRLKKANPKIDTTIKSTEEYEALEPIKRESFKQLCKDYEDTLYFTPIFQDTLAITLAVIVSTTLGGDQLWLRVIGPPGSGKSTLAECLSVARDYIFPVSSITGIHSGFTDGRSEKARQEDTSLVPKMIGKTTIVKDGDTLLSAQNKKEILAHLRDIYDGVSRAHYRNKVTRNYEDIRTTFIICATDEIRSLNRTFLGERFLDCEILGKTDAKPFLDAALVNTYQNVANSFPSTQSEEGENPDKMQRLKRCTLGFINHLKNSLETIKPPTTDLNIDKRIKALGTFLSFMRAKVKRDSKDDLGYRPRAELATRLVSQFGKLGMCLALVLNKPKVDNEVFRIVRKVAMDTATGFQLEITELLIEKRKGYTTAGIATSLGIPQTSVIRLLDNMGEFNIVNRHNTPNKTGNRGRDSHLWKLSTDIRKLHKQAGLGK